MKGTTFHVCESLQGRLITKAAPIPLRRGVTDMSEWEQEYLAGLRKHARDVRTFLSNANKPERERMIVRAFLRCLGVSFSDDEIQPSTEEPIDVRFRSARFQIMEIVGDKKRGDESLDMSISPISKPVAVSSKSSSISRRPWSSRASSS